MTEAAPMYPDETPAPAARTDYPEERWGDDDGSFVLEERRALRRVVGQSTELEDVTEVEYRQVRLERVVLIGVYDRALTAAETWIRELSALAETAGEVVLDGLLQRRPHPHPAAYLRKVEA